MNLILGAYGGVLLLLSLYGLHRLFILYLYFRYYKLKGAAEPSRLSRAHLPTVTVQVPLYNELYVARRIIEAVGNLDYPKDLLHIQILDDSTDETRTVAQEAVRDLIRRDFSALYKHRPHRKDFKAGALQEGLLLSSSELVAVFDADFVPAPDFLQRTVPYFQDEDVGMAQARWGYLNRSYSLLTRAQALLLDGHFMLEHTARCFSGRFFNFNGTAGVWRRQAILDAGGWQGETLTEDLDLSYRAQLKGWGFVFLPNLVCPSELPVEISGFKNQQHRWTKGAIQTCKKLLPEIWRRDLPFFVKCEATFHLASNLNYILMAALSLLAPLYLVYRVHTGFHGFIFLEAWMFAFSVASVGVFYAVSQKEIGRGFWRGLKETPLIFIVGIGMCLNNARAALEALMSQKSPFVRTAKYRIESREDDIRSKLYRTLGRGSFAWEGFLTLYMAASFALMLRLENWRALPFMLLFVLGYGYVAGLSWVHARR